MGIAAALLLTLALAGQGPSVDRTEPIAAQQSSRRPDAAQSSDAAALRRSIEQLTRQVVLLRQEMANQQSNDMRRFNANVARLQLVLADLDRMKKERADLTQRLSVVQARQNDTEDRLANIQRELVTSGELDRSAGEQRLRTGYNRLLFQAQSEASDIDRQLTQLDTRIERAEQMADTLRKRLKIDDSQIGVVEEPTPSRPVDDDAPATAPPPAETPRDQ